MGHTILARELREAMKEQYSIDHVVELQLIVAVLLENGIDEKQIEIATEFTNYFNKEWNLQTKPRKDNQSKKVAVINYIKWKYNSLIGEPSTFVFETISEIYSFYSKNRTLVSNEIKGVKEPLKQKFLQVEKALINLLECRNCKHPSLKFDFEIYEKEIYKHLSTKNNLDHIVEFQIIADVLAKNDIKNIDVAAKFAKYFNKDWNFKIIPREENYNKGSIVKNWLKSDLRTKPGVINAISQTYQSNRETVKFFIKNDNSLNQSERDLFIKVEITLNNLLTN
uniref:Uncharacterized protein n=1 Tax=Schmidtea mediterranea TaxID=79327 RepID=I1ZIC2_SCHMD|nr:hypothetical protein [Schmidtea mediterranea]